MIATFGRKLAALITGICILAIAGTVAFYMRAASTNLPLKQYFPRNQVNAVWDWSNIEAKDTRALADNARFMYMHQINTVYVDVSRYSDIEPNAKDNTQRQRQDAIDKAVKRYVEAMARRNIRVFVAAGDTTWSNRDEWYKPQRVLQHVIRYNTANPHTRLAGVEFDIESYNQPGFESGSPMAKSFVLTDFIALTDDLARRTAEHINKTRQPLELGFAVPYWFDNENGNIPSVEWNNSTGPTLFHVLDRLKGLPASNIVVMAYRNAASGNDGVIAHARTEVDYASAKSIKTRVIIGQEVNDVEPEKITYYGQTTAELSGQITSIATEFASSKAYGGIAINDLAGYRAMK